MQQSLQGYAQILLALDEMASEIKDQYAYKPDVDKPIKLVGLAGGKWSKAQTDKTSWSFQVSGIAVQ